MTANSKSLMDQINSEWDLIIKPFKEAEKQYQLDLKKLILKHAPIQTTFDEACQDSLLDLCEVRWGDHPKYYLDHTDVLENILNTYIYNLEFMHHE